MRIDTMLAEGRTNSFEFFPPITDEEQIALTRTLQELEDLKPSFVSVTYRGGSSSRDRTYALVRWLREHGKVESMAHLPCVHHVREELVEILEDYRSIGVENLLALGGDPDPEHGQAGELRHAIELVELAREVGGFSIGVAAHPAGHPLSPDLVTDRRHLAEKLRIADFAITQLFFDAVAWRRLVDELGALGVEKPVLPGIMPITTVASIGKMRDLGGVVPESLVERLHAAQEDGPKAVRAEGVAASTELCEELLELGAPGLHFFTMNRSTATREIFASLQHE